MKPKLAWRIAPSGTLMGYLENHQETTLFFTSLHPAVSGWYLYGAFIPDMHDRRFFSDLDIMKAAAQRYLDEWLEMVLKEPEIKWQSVCQKCGKPVEDDGEEFCGNCLAK